MTEFIDFHELKGVKMPKKVTLEDAELVVDRAVKRLMAERDIDYAEALDALTKERPELLARYEEIRSEDALERATAEAPLTRAEDVADYL